MHTASRSVLLNRIEVVRTAVWTVVLALGFASAAGATTITLHSGNGSIPGNDSMITFLDGPSTTDFASLTASNFTSAQSGPAAFIISRNAAWISSLSEDPSAQWIGDNLNAASTSGNTALYAESFTLPSAILSATLTVHYAVDNLLGSTNSGIFINGTAVSPVPAQGGFTSDNSYTNSNVGSLLHQGTNFIYFDAVNTGGPAGLMYTATITTVDAPSGAPEPATFGLLSCALAALAAGQRWLKRAA